MNAVTTETARPRRKVLLVDDDPLQRKLLARHLADAGHAVTACVGPTEALAAAALEVPDVIVSDVLMDDLDGFSFCREVRADPMLGAIPVLLLSAHFDDARDAILADEVGASMLLRRTPSVYPRIASFVDAVERHEPRTTASSEDVSRLHAERMRHQLVRLASDSTSAMARSDALLEQQARLLEQLQHAQALETVGQLSAGIVHDFNNSLAVILASTHMLLETVAADDPRRPDVEDVQAAAERATDLSRRMLSLGKRRENRRARPVELNGVVSAMGRMLGRALGRKVQLSLVLAPRLGELEGDVGEIEQVIANLAINARNAMPDGGLLEFTTQEIVVSAAEPHGDLAEGTYIVLGVRDTGCGMDEATKTRIFEPFFTTRAAGTGLGLATCNDVVKKLGGRIDVLSEPGRGALFRLYFPRYDRPRPGGETVLVVDDQVFIRNVIAKGLRNQGYAVLVAADRAEAIRIVETHPGTIDLLLSDWFFPEHDGMAVLAAVRDRIPEVRALFISGDPSCQAGSIPFLPKPFGSAELVTKVRAVLEAAA